MSEDKKLEELRKRVGAMLYDMHLLARATQTTLGSHYEAQAQAFAKVLKIIDEIDKEDLCDSSQ